MTTAPERSPHAVIIAAVETHVGFFIEFCAQDGMDAERLQKLYKEFSGGPIVATPLIAHPTGCQYVFKRGTKINQSCASMVRLEHGLCSKHRSAKMTHVQLQVDLAGLSDEEDEDDMNSTHESEIDNDDAPIMDNDIDDDDVQDW